MNTFFDQLSGAEQLNQQQAYRGHSQLGNLLGVQYDRRTEILNDLARQRADYPESYTPKKEAYISKVTAKPGYVIRYLGESFGKVTYCTVEAKKPSDYKWHERILIWFNT